MPKSLGPLVRGSALDATINAYRTCELVTLAKDGTPLAWPTSGISRSDGTRSPREPGRRRHPCFPRGRREVP
ncbi:hypothetical protein [Paractinoplanes durhamensis]|uniref:Uncharacterized protein n=1 Tax=Paractinoplanes durhamensis TaxID=113563 RepID=A0ABQ3Z4J3_9ACTN|nr:hypothetical protein Adu01nite_61130 [Actinoplanes durhamensis]